MNHDIVAIGASAGGIDILVGALAELPADLPASVLVVVHLPARAGGDLSELLARRAHLPASYPVHGEKLQRAHIYVAPPDNQLYLRDETIEVVRGPKENGHRPSVDALFRSAASAYGPRVIGVVLSGYQDCGTAGLMSIKARGGLAVVQDPATASAPDMPKSALEQVSVDHVVDPLELPGLLARLVALPVPAAAQPGTVVKQLEGRELGVPAHVVCPLCQGVMTEVEAGTFHHFRCHVGHTFSLDGLVREQSESMERAMWAAVRALDESAALSRRLSQSERGDLKARFAEKARTQAGHADLIRDRLLHGNILFEPVSPSALELGKPAAVKLRRPTGRKRRRSAPRAASGEARPPSASRAPADRSRRPSRGRGRPPAPSR